MLSIELEIDDKELQAYLKDLIKRNKRVQPLLERCRVWMIRSFVENFRNEGRPTKWRRLSDFTIAQRRKRSSAVLQDTGRLRMSCTVRRAKGNVTKFSSDTLTMGSTLKQASWLQYGTKSYDIRPKNKKFLKFLSPTNEVILTKLVRHPGIPARPFILIQDEDADELQRLASEFSLGE